MSIGNPNLGSRIVILGHDAASDWVLPLAENLASSPFPVAVEHRWSVRSDLAIGRAVAGDASFALDLGRALYDPGLAHAAHPEGDLNSAAVVVVPLLADLVQEVFYDGGAVLPAVRPNVVLDRAGHVRETEGAPMGLAPVAAVEAALAEHIGRLAPARVCLVNVFRHVTRGALDSKDEARLRRRIAEFNLMVVRLSHRLGAYVADVDAMMGNVGGLRLGDDFRATGLVAVQVVALEVARVVAEMLKDAP